jgi:hypothetical protein
MYRVLLNTRATGATLNVLMAIAWFANAAGEAWPSVRAIRTRAHVASFSTVMAAIDDLQELGELEVEQRQLVGRGGVQRANFYRLVKVLQPVEHLRAEGATAAVAKVLQSASKSPSRSLTKANVENSLSG